MKALLINGSPREFGNTYTALSELAHRLNEDGVETDIIWIGNKAMQGCIDCGTCYKKGSCAFADPIYEKVRQHLADADALIVGSPTYYGGPNGSLCALLDRLFFSCQKIIQNKVWAAVAICRRGGSTPTFQRLNMYAQMSNMVQATSQYWNIAFGCNAEEAKQDLEGMQTMRTLADNVAWLIKCTKDHKSEVAEKREPWSRFNFIR
jgi:multimeric flavodoxin WrbA